MLADTHLMPCLLAKSVWYFVQLQSVDPQDGPECREGKVNELLAERAALQKELGQQKEHHAQAQQHLRVSPGSECDLHSRDMV